MADEKRSNTDTVPSPDQTSTSLPEPQASRRLRRPVYEPSLLPTRKRRRASPWVVIPTLLIILGAILYVVLVLPRHRRFVPTVGEVAFATDRGTPGHPHIWLAAVDGSNAHRLTDSRDDETSPTWSPDGSQIAFLSGPAGSAPQVFVADADGRNVAQVTHTDGAKSQPQFAPSDNTLLAFLSGGALSTVDVPTGQTVRLLPVASNTSQTQNSDSGVTNGQTTTILSYAWMPVKERAQQGLAAIEDTGGVQALLLLPTLGDKPRDAQADGTPLAAADTVTAGWSPDGGLLAVALMGLPGPAASRGASALILLDSQGNASGQHPLAVFQANSLGPQHPVFSPDGSQVLSEVWLGADLAHQHSAGILTAPTDGSAPARPLYKGSATDLHFSADGQTICFLQLRPDGGRDLCRIKADGTDFTLLSENGTDTSSVAFSPQTSGQP